jgi:hypothetical protein
MSQKSKVRSLLYLQSKLSSVVAEICTSHCLVTEQAAAADSVLTVPSCWAYTFL